MNMEQHLFCWNWPSILMDLAIQLSAEDFTAELSSQEQMNLPFSWFTNVSRGGHLLSSRNLLDLIGPLIFLVIASFTSKRCELANLFPFWKIVGSTWLLSTLKSLLHRADLEKWSFKAHRWYLEREKESQCFINKYGVKLSTYKKKKRTNS